jgi:outer membrane protein TolC
MHLAKAMVALCLLASLPTRADPTAPKTLSQIVAEVLAHNPEVHAATARIEQAQAKLQEINAAFFPKITAGVRYTHTNDPSRAFGFIVAQRRFDFSMDINRPGFVEDFRPEVEASWSLFHGGRDWYARQAAELGLDALELQKAELNNRLYDAGFLRAARSPAPEGGSG